MSRVFRVAALSVVVACSLLAAQVSQQEHLLKRRHNTDWEEIENHDDDDNDDRSLGQSRAYGGENRTLWKGVFPWFDILYRNPDSKYKASGDGYLTGIAIQVEHNVLLAHQESMARASQYHGKTLVLQGWGNLWNKKFINPNKKVWDDPKDGYTRGVVRLLAELGPAFGLYRVTHDRYPYEPDKRSISMPKSTLTALARLASESVEDEAGAESEYRAEEGASRRKYDDLPPFDYPDGKEQVAYRYPRLNKNKTLASNCYVYALAAEDRAKDTWFDKDDVRWFARWPVKQLFCTYDTCKFEFDWDRADRKRTGIKRNAWQCSNWQDAGAPILCGYPSVNFWSHSEYYERRYLMLSYVLLPIDPPYLENSCKNKIWAVRVADHADAIESEIDKLRKSGTL